MLEPGDICICIKNFNSNLPGELLLYENDIVQIHKIIDKLWLEGTSAGIVGRFPASIVVTMEVPQHSDNLPLFVAAADFEPVQEGDLRLRRGTFVVGRNEIDSDWWFGESGGKVGVFPLNHVWKIKKELMKSFTLQNVVNMKGKVLTSTRAQLPEEVDLYAGDNVIITGIIDEDWYRGISCGQRGIFPSGCIELSEDASIAFQESNNLNNHNIPKSIIDDNFINESPGNVAEKEVTSATMAVVSRLADKEFFEPDITTLNSNAVDNSWRNINTTDVDALFEDDYFKQNMPSMYKPSVLSNKEVISGLMLENQGIKNDCDMGSSLNVLEDSNSLVTLSAKVDEYFNNDISGDNNIINKETLQDLLEIDFAVIYTEDNTGICPYGRAIFSFSAQYTNELSFKKGDIIHLIKHIDSHWTVGNLGNAKGIFPTSYIDIIVDCPYKAEENFARRPAYSSQESFVGHALVCYDFEAVNVEEVSIQKGDIVVIRDYINDEWVNVQKDEGNCGIVPLNHLQLSEETGNKICEQTSIFSPKNSKRYYDKSDFSNKNILDIDNALSLNLNSLKISSSNDKPLNTHSCSEFDSQIDNEELSSSSKPELPLEFATSKLQDNKDKETGKVKKTLVSSNDEKMLITEHCGCSSGQVPKSVISQPEKGAKKLQTSPTSINKETYLDNIQHAVSISSKKKGSAASEEKVCQNSTFPEDVSSISENTCAEDDAFASAELAPQRPAPPPPLDNVDTDQDGEACSLHTNGLSKGNLNESFLSELQLDNGQVNNARGEAEDSKVLKMLILRRESVRELVTTEYEYIHDLEALMQVVKVGSKKKEAASVDLKVLLGNIYEVIIFAKKFVALLDAVSYEKDYSMAIGPVFIDVAEEMCDVYKVYSSNNSISVGPLLKKYSEGGETEVFLNWILQELRQHKVNLLDMQAVLIKPIQRVLKYPLFIDHLVHNTPPSHPDFKNLEEARKKLLNVAKEINEYTKRLDLVSKYRCGSSHSFGEIIHRVTMRSVAKKGSRFKTRISATLGLINQTRDLQFEEEETQFHSIVKATLAVCEQGEKLVLNIKARHSAELGIIESFVATLLSDIQNSNVKAVDRICKETCTRLLPMFEKIVLSRVIGPAKTLGSMFKAPERLIQKRYDKLLDYDTAQHRLDKNRDPSRTRILEEELSIAKGVYEALNKQLLLDLPILNRRSIDVLQMAMQSLIAARMNLEGHVAKQYLDLAQFSEFSFQNNPDYVENFKSVYITHTEAFKKLAFLPPDFVLKSPKFGRRKSSFRSLGRESKRKISSEKVVPAGKTLIEIYQESNLFVVTNNYKAVNSLDLDLKAGTLVGVIKTKDPLGNNERWFVDDGERKGFAPVSYLKRYSPSTSFRDDISSAGNVSQYMEQRRQSHTSNLSQASLTHQRGPSASSEYGASSLHSHTPSVPEILNKANMIVNLPPVPTRVSQASDNEDISRISSNSPVETPPRYEDLFPHSSETGDSQKSFPHRYDYPPEEEDDDATQIPGNENIYAEIEQVDGLPGPRCSTNNEGEEPIYEVIPEDSLEQQTKAMDCALVQPESDEQQFFYYALYNFGGSDENQLSLYEGQVVLLLFAQGSEWWFAEDRNGKRGYVPASYLSKYS